MGQLGGGKIPKYVVQTAKEPMPEYVTKQLQQYIKGWEYKFFLDADILKFFDEHPHPDYPNLKDKFHSLAFGEHKADFFRYYFLLMKGGVYIDHDLMLYDNLDAIVGDKEFVSVSSANHGGSVFNGFLACTEKHPIVKDAVDHIYKTDIGNDYAAIIKKLATIVEAHKGPGVKLLKEIPNKTSLYQIQDPDTELISMIHYPGDPVPNIPLRT
jgi:mannosyltransferase OCH1-like enzyme